MPAALVAATALALLPPSAWAGLAQAPLSGPVPVGCGGTKQGVGVCLFSLQELGSVPSGAATLTATITGPADLEFASASAVDPNGDACEVASGSGTQTVRLQCPSGLQPDATVSVVLAPVEGYAYTYATVRYDAGNKESMMPFFFRYPPGPSTLLLPPIPAGGMATGAPPVAPPGTQLYPSGWNLLGGPTGWNLDAGSAFSTNAVAMYTYQAGDTSYENVPPDIPLLGGVGFWVYLASPTPVDAPFGSMAELTLQLPSNEWVMVGNPANMPATVSGADATYVFDPNMGSYVATTVLQVGQGAWVYSTHGGAVTIRRAQ